MYKNAIEHNTGVLSHPLHGGWDGDYLLKGTSQTLNVVVPI